MSAPNSSAPGPSSPGGELQQISPGAWPTANGGQQENSVPQAPIAPAPPQVIKHQKGIRTKKVRQPMTLSP